MPRIVGLHRLEEMTIRAGGNGDNWHMTRARDGAQYIGLCDGTGWPDVPGTRAKPTTCDGQLGDGLRARRDVVRQAKLPGVLGRARAVGAVGAGARGDALDAGRACGGARLPAADRAAVNRGGRQVVLAGVDRLWGDRRRRAVLRLQHAEGGGTDRLRGISHAVTGRGRQAAGAPARVDARESIGLGRRRGRARHADARARPARGGGRSIWMRALPLDCTRHRMLHPYGAAGVRGRRVLRRWTQEPQQLGTWYGFEIRPDSLGNCQIWLALA